MSDKDTPLPETEVETGTETPPAARGPEAGTRSEEPVADIAPSELAEPAAEPAPVLPPTEAPAPVPPAAPTRRGGFLAPLLGGAIAAILGFGLSHFNLLKLTPAQDDTAVQGQLKALETQLKQGLDTATAGITRLGGLAEETKADAARALTSSTEAAPKADLAALASRIDALEGTLQSALSTSTGGEGISPAALAALGGDLTRLQSEVAALQSASGTDPAAVSRIVDEKFAAWEADARANAEAEAETARSAALRDAALLSLREATVTGAPYGAALAALDIPAPPEVLTRHAEAGLPTPAALQASFPEAARAALEASLRATAGEGTGDRLWSFLRVQTGARSLTPQEGTDPDAVLSRAEAAVVADDLPKALSEIDSLPAEGKAALAEWSAEAQDLIAARAAIAALAPNTAPQTTP